MMNNVLKIQIFLLVSPKIHDFLVLLYHDGYKVTVLMYWHTDIFSDMIVFVTCKQISIWSDRIQTVAIELFTLEELVFAGQT